MDAALQSGARGGEVPLLIELAIVRQIRLGNDSPHLPAVEHYGAVEQSVVGAQRGSDDQDEVELARSLCKPGECGEHAVEQRVLEEQVLVGIAGERQFREHDEASVIVGSRLGEVEDLPSVVARIGHANARRGDSHADKSVGVGRVERQDGHGRATSSAMRRRQSATPREACGAYLRTRTGIGLWASDHASVGAIASLS